MGVFGAAARKMLPVSSGKRAIRAVRELYWGAAGPLRHPSAPAPRCRSPLFVCQGNICRSPFAEHLARAIAERRGYRDFRASSAGLRAPEPWGSPETAVAAAREFGVRLEDHAARQLTGELVAVHDAIVVMEAGQVHAVRRAFPEAAPRIVLLPSFDTDRGTLSHYQRYHIADPFGGDLSTFVACYARIRRCLEGLFEDPANGAVRRP